MAVLSGVLGFGGGMGPGDHRPVDARRRRLSPGLLVHRRLGSAGDHRRAGVGAAPPAVVGGIGDWIGAAGLAVGLSPLLLAITQARPGLDLTADRRRRCHGGCGTGRLRGRTAGPALVPTTMLTRRSMLLTNTATVAVGMGLYFGFLGAHRFVQTPTETATASRHRAGGQRGVPAARALGVRHRAGQWPIHRSHGVGWCCSPEPQRA